jgi:Family of unknown function (DUF5706)
VAAVTTALDRTEANLTAACADVRAEIARTDTKASLLLAFNGALLAGAWTVATTVAPPLCALVAGGVGLALVFASVMVLLTCTRPRLVGTASFPHWATLTHEQLAAEMAEDRRLHALSVLSGVAVRKMRSLQHAFDLTRAAGVLLAVAVVVGVIA